jgi:hypothetical protein
VSFGAGFLSAFDGEVGLDPLHEPPQPLPQLRPGVAGREGNDGLVKAAHGFLALQLIDRRGDVPHPGEIDQPVPERVPYRRSLLTHPIGRGQLVDHLTLTESGRLTDRQRNRTAFELHPQTRLKLGRARVLSIAVVEHLLDLEELSPRTPLHHVGQTVRGGCCAAGHTSNLGDPTDTFSRNRSE